MLPFLLNGEEKDKYSITKVANGWIVNFVDVTPPQKAAEEEEDETPPWEKSEFGGIEKLIKAASAMKAMAGSSTPKTLVFMDKLELLKFLSEKL